MPAPRPSSCLLAIDTLLRRYEGPAPHADLLRATTREPFQPLRQRAMSREIDRLASSTLRLIASHRARLAAHPGWFPEQHAAMDELTRRLSYCRELGLRVRS